jgi:predicted pyridoxine 5'-phosphate oxidase superfamily flavin-nucleotide-binding protein
MEDFMAKLTKDLINEWGKRDGPQILSTSTKDGIPNSVYVLSVNLYNDETIVIADNYFNKTKKNLEQNNNVSFLFFTKDEKAYQIKGTVSYHTSGEIYEYMKGWNPDRHPGHGAVALNINEVFSGSEKIL